MKLSTFLMVVLLGILPSRSVRAEMPLLPRTGQTTSYGARDDGALQRGVVWPTPRFTDNGNGTVTDNLTGLVWLRDANCFKGLVWSAALVAANSLSSGSCALTDGSQAGDWRMPNRKELKSLIDRQQGDISSWLTAKGFLNVQAGNYWSSSTYATNSDMDWLVRFSDGFISLGSKTGNVRNRQARRILS